MPCRALVLLVVSSLAACAGGPRATNPLTDYLAPTSVIDADHPDVIARAARLTSGVRTDPDRVAALVRFAGEPVGPSPCDEGVASRWLGCGPRTDTQKLLLLAALARAAGIPARLAAERATSADAAGTPLTVVRLTVDLHVGKRWQRVVVDPDDPAAAITRLPGASPDYSRALREMLERERADGPADYRTAIEKWRTDRERALTTDDGWLTVVGLSWLKPGNNALGSAPGSDVLLPEDGPARAGAIHLAGESIRFEAAPGVVALLDGAAVTSAALRYDGPSGPDTLRFGSVSVLVIRRAERFAIRVRDTESVLRAAFTGLTWFPVDERFRIPARWVPAVPPRSMPILNVLGMTDTYQSPGTAVFTLGGRTMRLDPVSTGTGSRRLFFIFRDATAGHETYPAGRFLYTDEPRDGTVTIDFNRAENPPCAFTPHATCPLPPKQNVLPIRIAAGETYR